MKTLRGMMNEKMADALFTKIGSVNWICIRRKYGFMMALWQGRDKILSTLVDKHAMGVDSKI